MKERPILFSAPMVRAILQGRKTQTRRVVKFPMNEWFDMQGVEADEREQHYRDGLETCPYGQPGDRLWVRETWAPIDRNQSHAKGQPAWYRADQAHEIEGFPWKPSIHMPRIASRITLEITSVRVERLNDINEQDAISEGVICNKDYNHDGDCHIHKNGCAIPVFSTLWTSINGEESWKENPLVWVIEFKRVEVKS